MTRHVVTALAVSVLLSHPLIAQSPDAQAPFDLTSRHVISLAVGAKTNSRSVVATDFSGVDLETGFVGTLSYGYWFDPQWQLNLSFGVFGAAMNTSYLGTKSAATMAALFGISYYPTALSMGAVGRPFVGIAPGVYTRSATKTGVLPLASASTVTEVVPGARFLLGVDLFPVRWLRLSPAASYHVVGTFKESAVGPGSYSGADFSLGFGVVL